MSKKKASNNKKGKQADQDDDWEAILEAERAANAVAAPAPPAAPVNPAPQTSSSSSVPSTAPQESTKEVIFCFSFQL
jgi:hypothetical protein